jgi:hypothetical protein
VPRDLDKVIDELVEQFRRELQELKHSGFESDYIDFIRQELREEFLIAKDKELEERFKKEIQAEYNQFSRNNSTGKSRSL